MKKLLSIALLFFAITANAQFVFKVEPKSFPTPKGDTITVTGIECKLIGNIEVNLTADTLYTRTFFIGFKTSTGSTINAFNTTSQLIAEDLVKSGFSWIQANAQVNGILKALEFGTRSQKFAAATGLCLAYDYKILPLDQQDE